MAEAREIVTELVICAPAERVWQVLTDFARYPEWNPMLKRVAGPLELGGKLSLAFQAGGRTVKARAKILELEAPHRLRWGGGTGPRLLWIEHYFHIEPAADGVRFIHGERFGGRLGPLALRALGKQPVRRYQRVNEALAERVLAEGA